MIASLLNSALEHSNNRPFLVSQNNQWTYADTHAMVGQLAHKLSAKRAGKIACYMPDSPELILLILAASVAGLPLAIINRDFSHEQVLALTSELETDLLFTDQLLPMDLPCRQQEPYKMSAPTEPRTVPSNIFDERDSELLILTSGTTQQPRCVKYLWSDLLAQVSTRQASDNERWMLAYKLNHFAGIQMLAHILSSRSTLVLAASTQVADAVATMTAQSVTHVSSTPTFWRFALALLTDSAALPGLRQITLGSEPVSADILDRLALLFPDARIVHIYALTEAGSCISISDGRPGLPLSILDRPSSAAVSFRIIENELQVKTRHGMLGYRNEADSEPITGDGWLATGDLVKVEGDRILFMGRESEVINVGGVKVHPLEVENIVSALPGVKLARVYGQENPVVGQIVAVELVINDGWGPNKVEDDVRLACSGLPRHSMPRNVTIVDTISTTNLKLSRRGSESS